MTSVNASNIAIPSSSSYDEPLIRCDNVSKKFCRNLKKSLWYGAKDFASDLFLSSSANHKLRKDEFWANKDISFEVRRGECLGLIGRNGAGKTTLLKILNGLIKPDSGQVTMRGGVAALIALGAGFNPVLTGRENVFVNGSILGLSRKAISTRLEEIVAFADLKEFIDAPVMSYSSGMQVRLGFAVAVLLVHPDILILDEVLAVGDAGFRAKCYEVLGKIIQNSAVIFVSHDIPSIRRICGRAILLDKGEMRFNGESSKACQIYNDSSTLTPSNESKGFVAVAEPFLRFDVTCESCNTDGLTSLHISVTVENTKTIQGYVRVQVFDNFGELCIESHEDSPYAMTFPAGLHGYSIRTSSLPIRSGQFTVGVVIYDESKYRTVAWSHQRIGFEVTGDLRAKSAVVLNLTMEHK